MWNKAKPFIIRSKYVEKIFFAKYLITSCKIYKCIASNVELYFTPGHFDFTKKYSCFSRKILLLKNSKDSELASKISGFYLICTLKDIFKNVSKCLYI